MFVVLRYNAQDNLTNATVFTDRNAAVEYFAHLKVSGYPAIIIKADTNPTYPDPLPHQPPLITDTGESKTKGMF